MPWRKERTPEECPDPEGAARRRDELRAQRPHVTRLIVALRVERELNNFGRNAEAVFLGRDEKR